MNVIIAGGRDFNDYELLKKECDRILEGMKDICIISGTAKGVDRMGERYAKDNGYKLKEFPAPWDETEGKPEHEIKTNRSGKKYWLKAGFHRNKAMAMNADMLIAFWDYKSKGTANMILTAIEHSLKTNVIEYKPDTK